MARDLHDDFYKRLRKRLRKWARTKEGRGNEAAEYILLAPDLFHLLVRLSFDPDVPFAEKAKVGAGLAYFLSPIDLVPEAVAGPLGYLDDVAIGMLVVHSILEQAGPVVVQRHWAGDEDLLGAVRRFLDRADDLLGSGLWDRIQGMVDRTGQAAAPETADKTRGAATKRAVKKRPASNTSKGPATRASAKRRPASAAKRTTKSAKKSAAKAPARRR